MKTLLIAIFISIFTIGIFPQSLNGNYTVGGNSPDFTTLQDAAHALFVNGMSGSVNINIRPGTYIKEGSPGPVLLLDSAIAGLSEVNRLTFQPDAASGGKVDNVILEIDCEINTGTTDREAAFIFNDYITLRNLTFFDADVMDTPANFLIRFGTGLISGNPSIEGLVIDGCKLIGETPFTDPFDRLLGTINGIEGSNITDAVITNNQFTNLTDGMSLNFNSGIGDNVEMNNNRIETFNNSITAGSAVYAGFANVFISNNYIDAAREGIQVSDPATGVIEANYIKASDNGYSGLFVDGHNVTDSMLVKNNIIIRKNLGNSIQIATRNTKILNNTIINTGPNNNTSAQIYGDSCTLLNNIILTYNGSTVLEVNSGTAGFISDHNVFFKTAQTGYFAHIGGAYYTTFDGYRLTGLDSNSAYTDVTFNFDSLGIHLEECQAQDSRLNGIPLPEVPVDYYGALRDSVKPFVGAVEGVRLPFDMFGDPFKSSLQGYALSIAQGRFEDVWGNGIVVSDYDNRQVHIFHNNGVTRTFTQLSSVSTGFKPTAVCIYDVDEDSHKDLIVAGDTSESSLEVFWGNGSGNFSGPDVVETDGRVRSIEPGPTFTNPAFTTIVTTEDNGFLPSTSFIGYTACTAGRQLCHQLTNEPNPPDTIYAVLDDFVLADVGGVGNVQSIIAPGIFGSSNPIPKLFVFEIQTPFDPASVCPDAQTDFWLYNNEFNFPVTGYYTNISSIVSGDFDGNGNTDFITTGWDDNYCVFIKGDGSLSFTADTIPSSATRGLTKLDYENDGDLDFVTVNNTLDSAGITVFLNDGVGNFTENKNCFFPFASGHPNGIVSADFDGDGLTDVAVISNTAGGGDSLFVLYNLGGFNQTTGVKQPLTSKEIPEKFELSQNYPNPFNPSTRINFNLPYASNVKIFVFNILGQKVKELLNEQISAGKHTINFNANNLASGIYIYQIVADTSNRKYTFQN